MSGPYKPEAAKAGLPPIDDAANLLKHLPPLPPQVVEGLLHQGCKAVLGGGSKSFKTWSLIDLAVSVATGVPWWGFETVRGKVLYLNLEVPRAFFASRLHSIAAAKGSQLPLSAGNLRLWSLRGFSNLGEIVRNVNSEGEKGGYSLIVVDPLYKLMTGKNENDAGEVGNVLAEIDKMAENTGAAIFYGHHYSKGNQATKESIDRMSGSGVFARDADTIISLTAHEEAYAYTVEMTLRNHPPAQPFAVRWVAPIMVRDEGLNPARLKPAKNGREAKYSSADVLKVLAEAGDMTATEWQTACKAELGIGESRFYDLKRDLNGSIHKSQLTGKLGVTPHALRKLQS